MGQYGTAATFFTDPTGGEAIPSALSDGLNDQWIQYKVWLETTDSSVTPKLLDVALSYQDVVAPLAPTAVAVGDGVINIANLSTVEVTGNAESGSTVEVRLTDGATPLVDGIIFLVDAKATDAAGNVGPYSAQ